MTAESREGGFSFKRLLQRHGALLALALLIVGTAVLELCLIEPDNRAFLKPENFLNILRQQSSVGIVAVGMTFVIILGGIDLSVGAMVALLGGASMYAMNAAKGGGSSDAMSIAAAFLVCLIGGPVLGSLNGIVIARGRIAPFIATLGTMMIFRSLILAPAQGAEIRSAVSTFGKIGSGSIKLPFIEIRDGVPLGIAYPSLAFIAVAAIGAVILRATSFGTRIYAVGDNARAARYSGVRVDRLTMVAYSICGFTCGVAALFASSRLNSVSTSQLGLSYELDAIAAVVIGGTSLQGGTGRVFGTVVGVLLLGVVTNMLNMLEVSTFYQDLVQGFIIIAAVLIQPSKQAD